MTERTAWRSLLLTVLLFAGQGVVAVGEMVRGATEGRPVVTLNALALLIAVGLTARLPFARRLGVVFAGLWLALLPVGVVVTLAVGFPSLVQDLGWVGAGSRLVADAPWWAVHGAIGAFQWRALRSADVRRLFPSPSDADGPRSLFPT